LSHSFKRPSSREDGSVTDVRAAAPRRRGRRILVWVGGVIVILLGVVAAVVFAFMRKFYPTAPEPKFPVPRDTAEAQLQDLTYLREYLALDKAYTADARAHATALLEETAARARAGAVSTSEFDLDVGRIAALADNGHSRLRPLSVSDRHRRLPCRMYHFDDGFYILRARSSCKELLGTKVVAIDGRAIDEVAEGMYRYFGGPPNHYHQFAAVFFLESPELLHAANLAASEERLRLSVVDKGGETRDLTVEADRADPEAPRTYSDEILSPRHISGESADWSALLPTDAALPLFLREYDNPFHAQELAEKGTYYAQFRSNGDEEGHPIDPFVKRVRTELTGAGLRNVVLDLRLDQGGNFTKTASLMEDLARLSGAIRHVYLLTSAWTFSAGILSAALAKEHGQGKVVIVGAPVGDRLRFWAEGGSLKLPNSKLVLSFTTGLHDYTSPCTGQDGCFWLLRFYPMHIATLEPDDRVSYTFADYAALRDPLLEKALSLAE
jgi:hypothetical protein